jgi:hypothetical protein
MLMVDVVWVIIGALLAVAVFWLDEYMKGL